MKKAYMTFLCFLHLGIGGCADFVKVEDGSTLGEIYHFQPIIDAEHLSPHPAILVDAISVGKNCKGQVFKVPPIKDLNKKDRLYYLWFLDNQLVWPQSIIEPDTRDEAIISLNIDRQFLLAHFQSKMPADFFSRQHVIDFFVSDVKYTIPESRYVDDAKDHDQKHSDYVYWIATFSDDEC